MGVSLLCKRIGGVVNTTQRNMKMKFNIGPRLKEGDLIPYKAWFIYWQNGSWHFEQTFREIRVKPDTFVHLILDEFELPPGPSKKELKKAGQG
ncbi:hypothetical protein N8Z24_00585 [bacterium]|nr:hypothetical protein [bacterium]